MHEVLLFWQSVAVALIGGGVISLVLNGFPFPKNQRMNFNGNSKSIGKNFTKMPNK